MEAQGRSTYLMLPTNLVMHLHLNKMLSLNEKYSLDGLLIDALVFQYIYIMQKISNPHFLCNLIWGKYYTLKTRISIDSQVLNRSKRQKYISHASTNLDVHLHLIKMPSVDKMYWLWRTIGRSIHVPVHKSEFSHYSPNPN